MRLYFTFEEKKQFLESRGYTVDTVQVKDYESCYHNRVEFFNTSITVAYKGKLDFSEEFREIIQFTYGVDNVFEKELKIAFKKAVLGI